jgi:MFS family permease
MSTYFQQDASRAGLLAGSVIVVGGGIGTIAGGYLADALLARGIASARLLVPSIGFLAAAPFVLLALLTGSLPTFLAMMLVASGLLQSANGPLTALSQDVITPARRARAVAISLLLTHLLGDAFAPVAIGSLSDARGGLQQALLLTPITLVAAALIGFIGCRFVDRDRVKVVDEARLTV